MMMQKRNALILSAVLATMTIAGCQRTANVPADVLDDTPIQVDPAMARRDWDESRATYANTGIRGTPTLFTFQSKPGQSNYQYAATEMPLFLTNVVLMPYQLFAAPIWKQKEFRAATIPPSHGAMPPLPPSNDGEISTPEAQAQEQPQPMPEASPEPMPAPAERPADQPAPRSR
ncbi:hypothetical protein BH09PLA1_BH09PLA1_13720 [soil metagenome]